MVVWCKFMLLINVAHMKTLFGAVFIPCVTLVNPTFAVVYSHLCLCHVMQFIVKKTNTF